MSALDPTRCQRYSEAICCLLKKIKGSKPHEDLYCRFKSEGGLIHHFLVPEAMISSLNVNNCNNKLGLFITDETILYINRPVQNMKLRILSMQGPNKVIAAKISGLFLGWKASMPI
jgi:hypothetical protein